MTPAHRTRVAILASGRGSNMAALLDAAANPAFPASIALVLSNQQDAPALDRARQAGIPAAVIPHRPYGPDREAHERAMDAMLADNAIELVCLAGYMRLLTPWFVARWAGRMLNVHPSLLPAFPGLHTHDRALQAGCRLHGCTVHLVTAAMDAGPILAQAAIPVLPGDTPDALATRVLAQEHLLYPAALAAFIRGTQALPDAGSALLNPLPWLHQAP